MAVAASLPANDVVAALHAVGATHVVTVPDTNQRTVLGQLDGSDPPAVVRAATEDDVLGICAGLWIAGCRPIALIQQLGIFASVNALRGLTYDLGVPLAILAGMYGRETDLAPEDSPKSSVRLCVPLLEALGVHWRLVEGPDETELIRGTLKSVFNTRRTAVVLLGAPTS